MKSIKFTNPNFYEVLGSIKDQFRMAFKLYENRKTMFIVSRKNGSHISIELRDIIAVIDERSTVIMVTKVGRVVMFSSGDFIAQFYANPVI